MYGSSGSGYWLCQLAFLYSVSYWKLTPNRTIPFPTQTDDENRIWRFEAHVWYLKLRSKILDVIIQSRFAISIKAQIKRVKETYNLLYPDHTQYREKWSMGKYYFLKWPQRVLVRSAGFYKYKCMTRPSKDNKINLIWFHTPSTSALYLIDTGNTYFPWNQYSSLSLSSVSQLLHCVSGVHVIHLQI